MADLTDFLLARVAEDEGGLHIAVVSDTPAGREEECTVTVASSRVLAECEAKRRIIAAHPAETRYNGDFYCLGCASHGCSECDLEDSPWPCFTLRILATPYAGHPDYRDEWRPDQG